MSIMPLSGTGGPAQNAGVRTARSTTVVVRDPRDPGRFAVRPNALWVRVLARVLAFSLDRQLASGHAPESNRLLAARAEWLVSPRVRRALGERWRDLVEQARAEAPRRGPVGRTPGAPLCRHRILAAEDAVQAMAGALATALPIPARGVAKASLLLSDGTGPLYNRGCGTDLPTVLREVTEELDPAVPLTASS